MKTENYVNPGFCEDCGKLLEDQKKCPDCGGDVVETWEEECPKCGEEHYHRPHNECNCCGEKSVEIGMHFPVLCYECSKVLGEIRQEINPCPNCGETKGRQDGKTGLHICGNSNCRVKYYDSEDNREVYDRIRERRGLDTGE
ncbi:hypothetical protein [Haloplanus natans]|uniref:hypothetical protein n=1 Tax=Haloplanus natans TaxID=376171 RepID=UPI0012FCD86A|nr:hypothetical protein [Haloplanus natans]